MPKPAETGFLAPETRHLPLTLGSFDLQRPGAVADLPRRHARLIQNRHKQIRHRRVELVSHTPAGLALAPHHGLPPQVRSRHVARRSPAPLATPFKPGGHDNLEVPCFKDDMSARASEAFVLQTYPFKEGDLIVSFLTRDLGKLRGVARRARRPKSGFGSGLERLSHVKMAYFQRENRELVNIDSCEILHSHFSLAGDFTAACALDYIAEVSEHLLPPNEPNEKYFRLLTAVLAHLRSPA